MSAQNDTQAAFMEAMNGLKEYAKVNGGFITKDDVLSYFKDLDLDDGKLQMVYGYLMANNIKIKGAASEDNEFLKMMETAEAEEIQKQEAEESKQEEQAGAKQLEESLDYAEDEKYLQLYLEDLKQVDMLSDTSLAFLLMNIVEDNDKNSLELLSQSFLGKVTEWITPYRGKGVLACDLVQEGNLAMLSYIGQKQWANNYEWKDKIKEGNTQDLLEVLHGIEKEVRELVEGSLEMMIDEQKESNQVAGRVLGKVNLVNDWAKRLRNELERKPTIQEVADKMGISPEQVTEAIRLSAEAIEDIDYVKTMPQADTKADVPNKPVGKISFQ